MRTAVVLFNLGGPSHPEAIKPFLFNFFMDKNIIPLPAPARWMVAKYIAHKRGSNEAKTSYGLLGGRSPLLDNTLDQAAALERALDHLYPDVNDELRVFVSMRYWHPMSADVVRDVAAFAPDKIVLLPLYPQFSTTTSGSSLEDWRLSAKKAGLDRVPVSEICCYPVDPGFVKASADNIRHALSIAPPDTRLLFSAHGLPEKVIAGGDPYQWQCEQTVKAIVAELNMLALDYEICYQSRVGPMKWIGPSTDEAIEKAVKDGKGIAIYPHAFVSEHVETLVEIDMEYRHKAEELGIKYFAKVDTVGDHPDFIAGLAALVKNGKTQRTCPPQFTRCGCACK